MNKLFHKLKLTKAKLLSLAIGLAVIASGSVAIAGFGPNRPVFDWNVPAERTGSTIGPVFNSFINTPVYGDERKFTDAKDSTVAGPSAYADQVNAEVGKEYTVRIYVHNNAHESTNASGLGVAKNTKVRVNVPNDLSNNQAITGYISADNDVDKNGNPVNGELFDTVDLKNASKKFVLDYVEGSAKLVNVGNTGGGTVLSDEIIRGGVKIDDDNSRDGNLQGCFQFQSFVTIKVKVVEPKLKVEKQVRKAGQQVWQESVDTVPGDTVQWLIRVTNPGEVVQRKVVSSDLLPPHLEYVDGTALWHHSQKQNIAYNFDQLEISDGDGGYIFGDYAANGGGFLIRFDTKVLGNFKDCSIRIRNIANAKSELSPDEIQDVADVTITRQDCDEEPPVEPPEEPEPPVIPPTTPPELPNTGAGDVAGIFLATTIAGTIAHRLVWVRRFDS
jgi:uncharacterized repeat protein (TIGR01451 family)